ncbi:MAG TPA: hypothetical protein PLS69_08120 [Terricaulis sp.]|nr:hypothetical protein [Terricaulis sp.]HRP12237.1 hypothetical protein [Terricaulis sp.]
MGLSLRTLLGALCIVAFVALAFISFAVLKFSGCNYDSIRELASPSGRYIARWISVDCGMNLHGNEVLLQDRRFPGLPGADGKPAGVVVTRDFFAMNRGSEMIWEGDVLVLRYATRTPPELMRASVSGARIEPRAVD